MFGSLYSVSDNNAAPSKFIKKTWKTKRIFHCKHSINLKNNLKSVHSVIDYIKSWDVNLHFFLTNKISINFSYFQFNRLKNIFFKRFGEPKLWFEIEKMFKSGSLCFSYDSIYWGNDFFCFSLLSRYLLELYLSELDTYILTLVSETSWNLFKGHHLSSSLYLSSICKSLPLKLEKNLLFYKRLSKFNNLRVSNLSNYFRKNFFRSTSLNLKRNFFYVRYANFFLIAFLSSRNYANFVFDKVLAFVRSNLVLDLKQTSINSYLEHELYFLGFKISIKNKSPQVNDRYKQQEVLKNYTSRAKFRINLFRKRILNSTTDRSNSEIFLHFLSIIKKKNFSSLSFKNKKVWSLVFQLECVKSLQYGKLLLTQDTVDNLNYSLYSEVKLFKSHKFVFYRKYSFSLYIKKLHFIIKELILFANDFFDASILPVDLILEKSVNMIHKKMCFFYENLYFRTFPQNKILNGSFPSKSGYIERIELYKNWQIYIPKKFILRKLRSWGFIHPYKNRPTSNSKFLSLDDFHIITKFSYVVNNFLLWFRCCDDFASIKFIIEIIKQSCFLTLSRKHNKSKSWAYSVFTPNLLLIKSFSSFAYGFPNAQFKYNLKKRSFGEKNFFFCDEKFFLINFVTG